MKNGNGNNKTPHSWAVKNWPTSVYPGSVSRGRHLVFTYRAQLVECEALTRIGRELVIMGEAYTTWLLSHRDRVVGFKDPPTKKK
jgi:hypothetical protein